MQPERLKEAAELRAALSDLDAVIVVAYGKLIPADWLELPRLGFINVHASLLLGLDAAPRWDQPRHPGRPRHKREHHDRRRPGHRFKFTAATKSPSR